MLIAVSAILLVLGVLAYRRALFGQVASTKDIGHSKPRKAEVADVGLLVLRLVILLLFAAVFIGAVFSRVWTERPRRVAVMLDVSESMSAVGAESAAAAVAEAFPLPSGATGQEWVFADSAKTISDFRLQIADSANAKRTRIGAALKTVGKTRPGAVVLLSDGQDNGEDDAVAAARDIGVPVYTVGFGGRAKRNASVEQVLPPAVVYSGDTVDVQVRVMMSGMEGEPPRGADSTTKTPRHKEDGAAKPEPPNPRTLEPYLTRVRLRGQEREVPIGPGTSEQGVPFRLVFGRPGRQVIEARLDSLPGESNYADNRRSVTIDVKPGRLRVAYVTNRPGPGTRMMLRALGSDERIEVESLVSVTGVISGKWVQSPGASGFASVETNDARDSPHFPDVFILDNVVETGSPEVWQSVADRVQAGAGALVLAGPDFQPGPSIGKVLNGTVGRAQAGTFTPELTAGGGVLPWFGRDVIDLAGVPPFVGLRPFNPIVNRQSPIANDLGVWLVAQENSVPLVLAGKAGKGKFVYVAAYPLWRWGFGPEQRPEQGTPLSTFVTGVVRHLAERDTSPFWLETDRPDLYQGQPVRLTMRAVAPDGRPWTGLSVMVRAQQVMSDERGAMNADSAEPARPETVTVPMTETGNGVYEATIEALGPGRYEALATAENGDSPPERATRGNAPVFLGKATTEFVVADQSLELANTGMNEGLLRAIAEASGGRFFSSDSLAREGAELTLGTYQRRFSFDPRRAAWAYVLIALLAGAEWLMRRRRGLL